MQCGGTAGRFGGGCSNVACQGALLPIGKVETQREVVGETVGGAGGFFSILVTIAVTAFLLLFLSEGFGIELEREKMAG